MPKTEKIGRYCLVAERKEEHPVEVTNEGKRKKKLLAQKQDEA